MNCKPGDLAIIVRDACELNIGKLVRVLDRELSENNEWRCEAMGTIVAEYFYTGMKYTCQPGEEVWIEDAFLRPIRGENEEISSPALEEIA